ncbi:MAG TPA: hypothetical protein PK665_14810, partial [Ignavibacteriaceae bacterium]|nr:hypothetical protein [Ignavibacteriaceae bacterium]
MFTKIFKLSLAVFLVVIFFGQQPVFAQLSGTKSIPGDYATIEAAIADLNIQGAGSAGVTFNIAAGHTETFSSDVSGHIGATGTSSSPIIFQKSGTGANPVITAGVGIGTMDGIIVISGGDYITFDGIDLSENPANTNDTTRMEWGYALLKRNSTAPIDGCNFVTIKNSTITFSNQNTASWGIYAANHIAKSTTGLTLSDSSDVMSYCKFYSNTITGSYNGIRIVSASTAGFFGRHNEIGVDGSNIITGFGGGSATAYGMNLEYQDYLEVANNIVIGGSPAHSTTIYGIRTGSANNANLDIYGNTVTLTQSNNITYGITNSTGSSGVNNTVNIYNNTIENFSNTNAGSYTMWLIYNLASPYNLNIYGNTVRGNFKSGTGNIYCIYNSPVSIPTNVKIYNNKVYDNISSGPIHGIYTTDANGISIYGNEIYNQTSNLTTTALAATGITIAGTSSSPLTAYVYNNFISDLKAPASASLDAIRGISITGTTVNSTRGIYYNTVFLNASSVGVNFGTSGMFHTYAATATSSVLDMRNNIFVNISTPKGTGKTVAFRRSASTNLGNYSELSNNNCFYAGTPGVSNVIYFDGTNFDQTLLDFKTRVVPRETNSISEDVPFVNVTTAPYDLHVKTNIATQIESGGTPITTPIAVTNDFDGDLRNVTTPDIGADEFNGIGSDFTPPSIIYTTLDNTTSTSNRTLTGVDITDQSGVNVVSGTAPRIYFKRSTDNNTFVDNTSLTNGWKYNETSNTSSPFSFEINYSLLFGGTGAQGGDTIQYFVVAQDLANPANIGINQGTFNSTPSSVNLTSAAFPITGDINSYRILVLLSGTITVGTGGDFPSLTGPGGLFAMINGNFVSGNIVAQIISNLTEPGTNALNQWVEQGAGNYSLTIQPDAAILRTISGSYTGGLIRLNGADRVTLDGRYNGSGNYLTFENTNAAANTAAIQLISLGAAQGCSNVTIQNCNIKAGSNTLSNIFGIFCGSSGTISTSNAGGADFANISILGNHISKSRNGIFARGTTASQMTNFIVSDNIIGSDNPDEYVLEYGIYNGYADAPQVIGNEIYNMIFDVSKWPIYFVANINNAVVSRNDIHSIKQPGTTGYNSTGIYFSSATNCTNNRIDNNMIYDLSTYGNTSMYLYGIRIAGGSNYKIYYNSVSINDTLGNQNANLPSACLYISAAATNIDIRNNIFVNTRVGNSPKNYAVHSPATTTFQFIDYNDYWTTEGILGYFGGDIATLTDWKVATSQDANSISDDPHFISNMDLHINPSFSVVCDMGTPIAEVTVDFDGDVRSTTTPDIGADEYDCGANTFPLSVNITDGWNMVSVPGINPDGMSVDTWWQYRDPLATV